MGGWDPPWEGSFLPQATEDFLLGGDNARKGRGSAGMCCRKLRLRGQGEVEGRPPSPWRPEATDALGSVSQGQDQMSQMQAGHVVQSLLVLGPSPQHPPRPSLQAPAPFLLCHPPSLCCSVPPPTLGSGSSLPLPRTLLVWSAHLPFPLGTHIPRSSSVFS